MVAKRKSSVALPKPVKKTTSVKRKKTTARTTRVNPDPLFAPLAAGPAEFKLEDYKLTPETVADIERRYTAEQEGKKFKYRRKPAVVEAVQWTGTKLDLPHWLSQNRFVIHNTTLEVHAPNGVMVVQSGDWIIYTDHDAMFMVQDHVFQTMYERVP